MSGSVTSSTSVPSGPARRFNHSRSSSESSQRSVCSELRYILSEFPAPELSCEPGVSHPAVPSQPRSQQEMIEYLRVRVQTVGILRLKEGKHMARPAKRGEVVQTIVGGELESILWANDDTSMVVRQGAPDHELYLMSQAEFEKNYDVVMKEEILDQGDMYNELRKEGFMYYPRTGSVVLVQMTEADVQFCSHGYSVAGYTGGQARPQLPVSGNFFALTRDVSEASGVSEVYNCFHAEAIYSLSQKEVRPVCTQQELFERFEPIMNERGIKRPRTGERMARPARVGEKVTTTVNGKTVGTRIAPDHNHMIVVHMTGEDTVIFLMSTAHFSAKYEISDSEVPESMALYRQKGHRMYKRKGDTFLYCLTETDIADFVPKGFWVDWSNKPQSARAGDYLAMPSPMNASNPEVHICHHARAFYDLPVEEVVEQVEEHKASDKEEKRMMKKERKLTLGRERKEEAENKKLAEKQDQERKDEEELKLRNLKRALSLASALFVLFMSELSSESMVLALGFLVYGGWVSENTEKICQLVVPFCGVIAVADWCDDSWDLDDDVSGYVNLSYGAVAAKLYENIQWLAAQQQQ